MKLRCGKLKITLWSIGVLALSGSLAGCNPYPLPGPLHYSRCGPDAHTESYPHAKYKRDAYGCKTDDDGYLEGGVQGDKAKN